MGWNLKIQYYLTAALFIGVVGLVVTAYKELFYPSPLFCFILGMLSLALYIVHILQRQTNRKKEIALFSLILLYINLMVSTFIFDNWKWEALFTRVELAKLFFIIFLLASIYFVFAYVRVKVSFKKVKGNQKHNTKWRMSKRKQENLNKSDDIYIILGVSYENPDK